MHAPRRESQRVTPSSTAAPLRPEHGAGVVLTSDVTGPVPLHDRNAVHPFRPSESSGRSLFLLRLLRLVNRELPDEIRELAALTFHALEHAVDGVE